MSVTVTHPEYDARLDEWERICAVLAGRDEVISAGEEFVPMLGGQNAAQYQSYLLRGLWFGATQRTRKGIVGLVFSQDPQIVAPKSIEKYFEDITLTDISLYEFAKEVFSEVVAYNWGGILVDVPPSEEVVDPADDRPYLTFYHARNVRWWRRERIRGKMVTTAVILKECREVPVPDQNYGSTYQNIFRVLKLEKIKNENGFPTYEYIQEEWEEVDDPKDPLKKQKEWTITRTIVPKRKGKPFSEIPFVFITTEGIDPHINKSDLLDLVDMNLDHWRLTVDLRHGLHFTALPTPCASAIPDGLDLRIGSETAWTSTDPAFKSWYLEFSGAGIKSIEDAIERDEHLMSLLGSRLLETQKRAAETADAILLRQNSEDSVVMSAARSVEKGIEKALWFMSRWVSGEKDPDVSVSLTRALQDLALTTADLIVLFKAYQAGAISERTWLEALIRKQWVKNRSWDQEAALLPETPPQVELAKMEGENKAMLDRTTVTTGGGITNDRNFQSTT